MGRTTKLLTALLAVALLVGAVAGCSSKSTKASKHGPPATAPPGLPAFYAVPTPLPAGKPGQIIRSETISAPDLHGKLLRIMYHSKSLQGHDIAVTGLIAIPSAAPPAGGYPVIAWAHGTTGIADKCAPSLQPDSAIPLANKLLDAGYLVAATDYEGLGTPGRHPYVVGDSEARGVLDSVRAARNLPDAHASDRFLVWGHSQGGHAAMFTWHDAAQWAPELHLVGAVAGAPPSQLELVYQALQNSPYKFYLLMAAAGFNAAYGNKAAPLDAVMTQQGIDQLPVVDQQCGDEMVKTFANVNTAGLVKADPASVPTWKKLLDENDPGKFTTAQPQQLLIIQGGNDEQIPVASTQLLYGQLCAIHQDTERWIYPGQSHAGVIPVSFDDMFHWIQDRFANKPGPDPLQPTGQANVQVQRCGGPSGTSGTSVPSGASAG